MMTPLGAQQSPSALPKAHKSLIILKIPQTCWNTTDLDLASSRHERKSMIPLSSLVEAGYPPMNIVVILPKAVVHFYASTWWRARHAKTHVLFPNSNGSTYSVFLLLEKNLDGEPPKQHHGASPWKVKDLHVLGYLHSSPIRPLGPPRWGGL